VNKESSALCFDGCPQALCHVDRIRFAVGDSEGQGEHVADEGFRLGKRLLEIVFGRWTPVGKGGHARMMRPALAAIGPVVVAVGAGHRSAEDIVCFECVAQFDCLDSGFAEEVGFDAGVTVRVAAHSRGQSWNAAEGFREDVIQTATVLPNRVELAELRERDGRREFRHAILSAAEVRSIAERRPGRG